MATLRSLTTNEIHLLEAAHTVGRSERSSLQISDRRISVQHAILRWTGEFWEIKDLNSRNGTRADGMLLGKGEERRLRRGTVLSFGPDEQRWELTDDAPPDVMLVPLDGGSPVHPADGLLAIPSADDPVTTIYCADDGRWLMEGEDEPGPIPVSDGQRVDVRGRRYRLCIPRQVVQTALDGEALRSLKEATIRFIVSQHEESVRVQVVIAGETTDLGTRSHNYLLLMLARRRLADVEQCHPDAECGWAYADELAREPGASEQQVNIDVFRIRKQFARVAVADAPTIIERRARLKQLRLGVPQIIIERG